VAGNPELNLKSVFTDNGETGTDYDRPAWNDLMFECRAGRINCIVVRDLSRLGRNYIETGELLEKILPMLGVRLISVNDNYDNLHLTLNEQLVANLKNLINDLYSQDIGRKVSSAVRTKKQNGEFMGTYAAYGYLKDPCNNHKLVIDPVTAPVVEQIFKWKAEGVSNAGICVKLNESGIPSPNRYRLQTGILKNDRYADCEWRTASVKPILQNPVYLGKLAQGKKSSMLGMDKREKRIRPEDWIIVEGTHEPIISQELFDQAHAVMGANAKQYWENTKKHEHIESHAEILKGLVLCADCKRPIHRARRVVKGKYVYYVYVCQTHERYKSCPRKYINESDLIAAVYAIVRLETDTFASIKQTLEKLNRENGHKSRITRFDAEIEETAKEIRRIASLKQGVFEDYAGKLLTLSEYQFASVKYDADTEKQKQRLEAAKAEKSEYIDASTPANKWILAVSRFMDEKELTAEMVKTLIERVEIGDSNKAEVVFKFRDEYKAVKEYMDSRADHLHVADSSPVRPGVA
jgi:DNA invertase Pin-like site-specific DNA recombinase